MERSLRVLVISLVYPPDSIGGYEVMCAQVCQWLQHHGHNVKVLTSIPPAAHIVRENPWQGSTILVQRTLHSYWNGRECLYPSFRESLAIELANQAQLQDVLATFQPDVVSFWHMGAMSLSLITTTQRLGYPMMFVIGDDWLCYGGWADAWLRRFSYHPQRTRPVERLTGLSTSLPDLGTAGVFCFVSDHTRRRAEEVGGWHFSNIGITHPGVSLAEFPPLFTAPERPWRWRLLCPGRVTQKKGVESAIKALGLLPEQAELAIIGPIDPIYRQFLQEMAATLKVAHRLTFSLAPHQEMHARYEQADVTLFLSAIEHEAFGLVPLESMASGCPVVATCIGGSGEYCQDGINCLSCAVGDIEGLALAIQRLAAHPALRQRLIKGGLLTARKLTLDRQAALIEEWLVKVAIKHT